MRKSAASKKVWANPDLRVRISKAKKRAWADPEVRARRMATKGKAIQYRMVLEKIEQLLARDMVVSIDPIMHRVRKIAQEALCTGSNRYDMVRAALRDFRGADGTL